MTIVRKIISIAAVGLLTSVSLPSYAEPVGEGSCVILRTKPNKMTNGLTVIGAQVYWDAQGKQPRGVMHEASPMYVTAIRGTMAQVVRDTDVDNPNADRAWIRVKDLEWQSHWSCQ